VGVEWGMVIMGYVQVRLKYPDVFQPAHKTDSTSLLKIKAIHGHNTSFISRQWSKRGHRIFKKLSLYELAIDPYSFEVLKQKKVLTYLRRFLKAHQTTSTV
jgi:hypothetical protein